MIRLAEVLTHLKQLHLLEQQNKMRIERVRNAMNGGKQTSQAVWQMVSNKLWISPDHEDTKRGAVATRDLSPRQWGQIRNMDS